VAVALAAAASVTAPPTRSMRPRPGAHELLDVAGELAAEIERQDLASGVLGAGRRQRRGG